MQRVAAALVVTLLAACAPYGPAPNTGLAPDAGPGAETAPAPELLPAAPPPAPRPVPIRDRYAKARLELLRAINRDRRAAGLAPVALDSLASVAAQRHAEAMAAGDFFSHYDRTGRAPYERLAGLGGTAHVVENVFRREERTEDPLLDDDPWDRFDPVDAHAALMESRSHRAAILDPHRTGVGLGFAVDPARRAVFAVEEFVAWHATLTAPPSVPAGRPGRVAGRVLAADVGPLALVLHRQPAVRRWPGGEPPGGPYDDGGGEARMVPPWDFTISPDGAFTIDVGADLPAGRWYGVLYVAPRREVDLALRRRRATTSQGWPGAAFLLEVHSVARRAR